MKAIDKLECKYTQTLLTIEGLWGSLICRQKQVRMKMASDGQNKMQNGQKMIAEGMKRTLGADIERICFDRRKKIRKRRMSTLSNKPE